MKSFSLIARRLFVASAALVSLSLTVTAQEAEKQPAAGAAGDTQFAKPTIDIGMVVSDLDRSVKWYTEALGLKEQTKFDVSGEFGEKLGLSNKLPLHVRVLVLGEGDGATSLKLMQFKTAPGARVDQTFIHSTYGLRYLTLFVKDIDAAMALAAKHGTKPIGAGVIPLPEGFPKGVFIAVVRDPDGNFVELIGPKASESK